MTILMDELIDPNWLSAIDGIVISVFVFLLGIPLLIFQTLLPDGIKEIYNKRVGFSQDIIIVVRFAILCMFLILLLGNSGVNYFITNNLSQDNGSLWKKIYYWSGFLLLALFLFFTFRFFLKKIKITDNLRLVLVRKICNDCKAYYDDNGAINPEDISDLNFLLKAFFHTMYFKPAIQAVREIFHHVISSNTYNGNKLERIINDLLIDFYIINKNENLDQISFYEVINLSDIIINVQKANSASVDLRQLKKLLLISGEIALQQEDESNFDYCISKLWEIEKLPIVTERPYDEIFILVKKLYCSRRYRFVYLEIERLKKYLLISGNTSFKKVISIITYLAWVKHLNNPESLPYILKTIKQLKDAGIISHAKCIKVKENYTKLNEFETAFIINSELCSETSVWAEA